MLLIAVAGLLSNFKAVNPQALIDRICQKGNLPGMGIAIVRLTGEPEIYVTGVRKMGEKTPVKIGDTWHLGSNTKAFSAALLASLIDQGKGAYNQRVVDVLHIAKPDPTHSGTTIADILGMRGNLAANPTKGWHAYQALSGSLVEKRQAVATDVFSSTAEGVKPDTWTYSNTGFVMVGHISEVWAGALYEDALQQRILKPLGIKSAGFGPNPVGQPAPHVDGIPIAWDYPDNPAVMDPAGCLRMSLQDWATWVREVMLSVKGESSKLPASYGEKIRNASDKNEYVNGWIKVRRSWSKGAVLSHSGSNRMNYSSAWIAPTEGVAYIAVTNDGGKTAASSLDTAIAALILGKE